MILDRSRSALLKLRAALVGVLALAMLGTGLWLELAPQAEPASDDVLAAMLAAGAMCSGAAGQGDTQTPHKFPVTHQHAHCLLCQAGVVPFVLADAAEMAVPVTSIRLSSLPWVWPTQAPSFPLPYTSRAPPMIG